MGSKQASQHRSLNNSQKAERRIGHRRVSLLFVLFLIVLGSTPGMASDDTCIDCHGDYSQIHEQFAGHTGSSTEEGIVALFPDTGHDIAGRVPPSPYFGISVNCILCHDNDLLNVHAQNCATCHPIPYEQLGGPWNGTCQQGGCHNTYHDDVFAAHLPYDSPAAPYEQCLLCHNDNSSSEPFAVTQQNCLNCHAPYMNDTTPPITTSDALALYEGGAVIKFSITDNGRIGIGTTFYRLDDGATTTGPSVTVNAPGPHTLEFWSVDQAGNVEDPPNVITFELFSDTTPPTTVATIVPVGEGLYHQGVYYQGANINLTATDNSATGVFATYYRVNGGPTQTGAQVVIPAPPGNSSYTVDYWSVDFGYNVETEQTVTLNVIGGYATIRMIWGYTQVPDIQPGDSMSYHVRYGSLTGTSAGAGSSSYPWSGINTVSVPLRPPTQQYFVRILWNDADYGSGMSSFSNIYPTIPGQVIDLRY